MANRKTEWLDTAMAAELIGKSKDWLERARKRKEGPPWYRVGGRVFYAQDDVLEWLESRFCQ